MNTKKIDSIEQIKSNPFIVKIQFLLQLLSWPFYFIGGISIGGTIYQSIYNKQNYSGKEIIIGYTVGAILLGLGALLKLISSKMREKFFTLGDWYLFMTNAIKKNLHKLATEGAINIINQSNTSDSNNKILAKAYIYLAYNNKEYNDYWTKVIPILDVIIDNEPDNIEVRTDKVQALQNISNNKEALKEIENIYTISKTSDIRLLSMQITNLTALGQFFEAMKVLFKMATESNQFNIAGDALQSIINEHLNMITINSSILKDSIQANLDNSLIVYIVKDCNKKYVNTNGKEGKRYDDIIGQLVLSTDSKHLAYIAKDSDKMLVVVNEKEENKYNSISGFPVFSPDSKHLAYIVKEDNKMFVVLDGKEENKYDEIFESPAFSPDSKNIAYVVKIGDKKSVIINQKEYQKYENIFGNIVFSPDNKHIAYIVRLGNKKCVVIDEKEEQTYNNILQGSIAFSPDSKRLAYIAMQGFNFIICDGKPELTFCDTFYSAPFFSPDSKRLAYIGSKHGEQFVIIDGRKINNKGYDRIRNCKFNSESTVVTYEAYIDNQWITFRYTDLT